MERGEEPWWKDAAFRWADTKFLPWGRSVIGAEVAKETHVSLASSCQRFCHDFFWTTRTASPRGSWICLILAQISEMPWQVFLHQLPCQRSIFSSGANHWVTPQDLDIATLNSTISFVTSLESQKGPMFSAASACQSHCFPHESEDKAPISQSTLTIACNLGPREVPWSSNGKPLLHLLLVPGSGNCPWGCVEGPTSETKLRLSLLTHTYFALSFLQSAFANCYQPITNALTHPNSSGRDHWGPTRIPQYKDI